MKDMVDLSLAQKVIKLMEDLEKWRTEIERGMDKTYNAYSFDDIVASIMRQERHFYEFDGCCIIMQLDELPQYRVYTCFLACGSTEAILAAEPQLTSVAKELGCRYLTISGRAGWARRLKDEGWRHMCSSFCKEIVQ